MSNIPWNDDQANMEERYKLVERVQWRISDEFGYDASALQDRDLDELIGAVVDYVHGHGMDEKAATYRAFTDFVAEHGGGGAFGLAVAD